MRYIVSKSDGSFDVVDAEHFTIENGDLWFFNKWGGSSNLAASVAAFASGVWSRVLPDEAGKDEDS